jgi:hypothetical protein
MLCTDLAGAELLLSKNRQTVWRYRSDGLVRDISLRGKTYIPISDIAKVKGQPLKKVLAMADNKDIPVWQVKK